MNEIEVGENSYFYFILILKMDLDLLWLSAYYNVHLNNFLLSLI